MHCRDSAFKRSKKIKGNIFLDLAIFFAQVQLSCVSNTELSDYAYYRYQVEDRFWILVTKPFCIRKNKALASNSTPGLINSNL